jgi:hypothetical protein
MALEVVKVLLKAVALEEVEVLEGVAVLLQIKLLRKPENQKWLNGIKKLLIK